MGNALLYRCELDPVLRELAIMRVGRLSRAAYEVFQHERIAREVGVTEDKIAALRDATIEAPAFTDNEKAVLRFTDDVVRNVKASDKTLKAVEAFLTPRRARRAHVDHRLLHDGLPLPRDDRRRGRGRPGRVAQDGEAVDGAHGVPRPDRAVHARDQYLQQTEDHARTTIAGAG